MVILRVDSLQMKVFKVTQKQNGLKNMKIAFYFNIYRLHILLSQ